MNELERFRIRMIGEEHNRRRRLEQRRRWTEPTMMLSALVTIVKAWLIR